jgi:hypothetical protein
MSPSDDLIAFGRDDDEDGRVLYSMSYSASEPESPDAQLDRWPFGFDDHDHDEGEVVAAPGPLERFLSSRAAPVALAVVAVIAAAAALVGRLSADAPTPAAALPGPSGLTANQSSCLDFALVQRRAALLLGGGHGAAGAERADAINHEVRALDRLAGSNPTIDYRLVSAFADVADESMQMLGVRGRALAPIAVQWVDSGRAAERVCLDVAGFDVDARQPVADP